VTNNTKAKALHCYVTSQEITRMWRHIMELYSVTKQQTSKTIAVYYLKLC